MIPRLTRLTAPTIEPITLSDVKTHLRVSHSGDDSILPGMITTARVAVENDSGRALISQKFRIYYPCLSVDMPVPAVPLISVDAIKYIDSLGVEKTLSSALYRAVQKQNDPFIRPSFDGSGGLSVYPDDITSDRDAVYIDVTAGYGESAATVPDDLKYAIILKIKQEYDRGAAFKDEEGRLLSAYQTIISRYKYMRL